MGSALSDEFRSFLFEYRYEGATWAIEIQARDAEDARYRIKALSLARLLGPVVLDLPENLSPLGRLIVRLRNLLRFGVHDLFST